MYETIFKLQADMFKALAHPRRLEIVNLLRHQALSVTEIYSMLDLPQANISQHLMILREAGVVSTQKNGKHVVYHLTDNRLLEACDSIRFFLIDQVTDSSLAQALGQEPRSLLPLTHDPVCHMRVSVKTAGAKCDHQGKTYYFCASGCKKAFLANPKKYLVK